MDLYKNNFNKVVSEFKFTFSDVDNGRKKAFKIAELQDKRKEKYYTEHAIDDWDEKDEFKKFTCFGVILIHCDFDNDKMVCAFLPCRRTMTEDAYRNAYNIDIDVLMAKRFKFKNEQLKIACKMNGIKPKSKWTKKEYIKALMGV